VDTVLHCECGFEARAADEERLVAEVQRHAREAHGMALSPDQTLVLLFRAELAAALTTPHKGSQAEREEK
jgi:Protein of unknown function (DUF1059)